MILFTCANFGRVAGNPFAHGTAPAGSNLPTDDLYWDRLGDESVSTGHLRILELLDTLGIQCTFFAEGYAAELYPEQLQRWARAGHEIAQHGWKHEEWAGLDPVTEDHLLQLSAKAFAGVLDHGPVGFCPPGGRINPASDGLLERHGIRYVSLMQEALSGPSSAIATAFEESGVRFSGQDGSARRRHEIVATRLPNIPFSTENIDTGLINPASGGLFGKLNGDEAYAIFLQRFLLHERTHPELPILFSAHPFISGLKSFPGLKTFLTGLHREFGSGAFMTTGAYVLGPRSGA